jgi:lipopolysaccharide transport system permease protein
VYFPRLVIPLSALGLALVDFLIVLVLFSVMAPLRGVTPGWPVLLLPVFVLLALVLALGAGLWLTSLTVKYRDFRYIVPFALQLGLFVSPVGFRTENHPNWHGLLVLNPLTGVIDGFRWCLLDGSQRLDLLALTYSVVIALLLLLSGIWYFRKTERQFADVI